jgi:hypothetical protein
MVVVGPNDDGALTDTVARATVSIDPDSGTAHATISVVLLESPQLFVVMLTAFRSSDGAVLFTGLDTVAVAATGGSGEGQQVSIPVTYAGPRAARLVLAPQDTVIGAGESFTLRTATFDSQDNPVDVEARFYLVNLADAGRLQVNRLTGRVTTTAGQSGAVQVYAFTPDTAALDTTTIYVVAGGAPTRVSPGYVNVAVGGTVALSPVDATGTPAAVTVTWTSRATGVATVSGAGVVTGAAPGTAVIVASGTGFSDSVLVTVPPGGNVVASATSNDRGFRDARAGDTVVVDVRADMQFASGERLGSYNARLTWNPAVLQFVDVQSGAFAAPTVNTDSVSAGRLRFASADAGGAAGHVVVARVRLRALAAGSAGSALTVSEMSASSPSYTNLVSRVTVTNGFITVRP